MTLEQLTQAARQYAISATGLPANKVYLEHTTTAPPERPCISLFVLTPGATRGTAAYATTSTAGSGDNVVQQYAGERRARVRFSAYGATGYDLLEAMRRGEELESLRDRQRELLISFAMEQPQMVPELVDGQAFEERAIATAQIAYVARYTEEVTPADRFTGSSPAGEDFIFLVDATPDVP